MELALKILCRFFFTLGREPTERRTTSPFYSKKSGCGNNYNFERRSWRLNGTMLYLGRRTGRARDPFSGQGKPSFRLTSTTAVQNYNCCHIHSFWSKKAR